MSEQKKSLLEALAMHQKLRRCNVSVLAGDIQEAANHLGQGASPNLVIVESDQTGETLLKQLENLAQHCSAETSVMLLGATNDIHLYKQLTAMGVTDYFSEGSNEQEILVSIERNFSDVDPAEQAHVIAFIGVAGGVGSSSLAANTAYTLGTQYKEKVTLVDLDLAFGTSSLEFNIDPSQTVSDALDTPERLDNTLLERFLMPYDEQVSVLTSPATLTERQSVRTESVEILLKLVRNLSNFVVLDLPNLWQPWVQELLLQANETIVVAYPDLAGTRNTKNIMEFLKEGRGVDMPTRLLLNKVGATKKTELRMKDFETAAQSKPFLSIQHEPALFGTAMNNGELAVAANKNSKLAQKISLLTAEISGRTDRKVVHKKNLLLSLIGKK